jgi:hypothetical protein
MSIPVMQQKQLKSWVQTGTQAVENMRTETEAI